MANGHNQQNSGTKEAPNTDCKLYMDPLANMIGSPAFGGYAVLCMDADKKPETKITEPQVGTPQQQQLINNGAKGRSI